MIPLIAQMPLMHMLFIAYYIMNPNGTMNSSFQANSLTSALSSANTDTNNWLIWVFPVLPFLIIFGGLSLKMNPTAAAFVGSIIAAIIAVIDTGLFTTVASQTVNLPLYTFIAVIVVTAVAYLLTGVEKPYN